MKRLLPHMLAIGSALLLTGYSGVVREAGFRAVARSVGIVSWGHFLAVMGLWALAGFCLALPALTLARKGVHPHWPTLAVYLIPGLVLACTLPIYLATGYAGLRGLSLGWMDTLMKYGLDRVGSLLVGYGLAQSVLPTRPGTAA